MTPTISTDKNLIRYQAGRLMGAYQNLGSIDMSRFTPSARQYFIDAHAKAGVAIRDLQKLAGVADTQTPQQGVGFIFILTGLALSAIAGGALGWKLTKDASAATEASDKAAAISDMIKNNVSPETAADVVLGRTNDWEKIAKYGVIIAVIGGVWWYAKKK